MRSAIALLFCAVAAIGASAHVIGAGKLEARVTVDDPILLDNAAVKSENGVVTPYKRAYQQMKRSIDISQHSGDGMPAVRGLGDGTIELFDREANDADDVLRRALQEQAGL